MTDHAKLIADDVVQRVAELPDRTTDWPEAMLVTADELRAIVIAALIADRPVFWQHAIQECNEAHQALDLKGAPRTKTVARLRGVGEQEITLGLRARIQALTADRAAEAAPAEGLTGDERDELDNLLAAVILPTFTPREREIARRAARAALDAVAQGGEPVRGVHGPVREGSLLCFCGREWPHGSKGSAR